MSEQPRESKKSEPNWDMTPYFPAFAGPEYQAFRRALDADVATLLARAREVEALTQANLNGWAALLLELEAVSARASHLTGYLACLGAADSADEPVQSQTAAVARSRVELEKLLVQVRAALREADDRIFAELLARPELHDVAYFLERLRMRATWSMLPELEALAAELGVDGLSAWGRLYDQVSGRLEFDLRVPGQTERRLPVSLSPSLLEDPDPAVRRAALSGSNSAWEGVAPIAQACINAISGTRLTLYRRRGISHFLEPALFDAAMSQQTLDTLFNVVSARRGVAQRYLQRKAAILGKPRLGFSDLMASLPVDGHSRIPWDAARERVLTAFGSLYPKLAKFASDAFERRWIDYEPRADKRPGGFCSTSPLIGESRVFITYNETLLDVSTLAHELGHAFHGWLMRDMRAWKRCYPMTLAETASTFAEQLVSEAALDDPQTSAVERAIVLDRRMQDASTFLLNIPMRFEFERCVYRERSQGELSVGRLKELMQSAQQSCYGDALDQDELDPWFWASKLHFFLTGISFYNFPYTFGYLFSLGIFARARQEGPAFLPRYEELLQLTGSDSVEGVASRTLDVDLEAPDFWNASIDLLEDELERFLAEADALFPETRGAA